MTVPRRWGTCGRSSEGRPLLPRGLMPRLCGLLGAGARAVAVARRVGKQGYGPRQGGLARTCNSGVGVSGNRSSVGSNQVTGNQNQATSKMPPSYRNEVGCFQVVRIKMYQVTGFILPTLLMKETLFSKVVCCAHKALYYCTCTRSGPFPVILILYVMISWTCQFLDETKIPDCFSAGIQPQA